MKLSKKKKKNVRDKLAANVNAIDTSGFVFKTKYTFKSDLEKKILDTSGLVKKQMKMLKLLK